MTSNNPFVNKLQPKVIYGDDPNRNSTYGEPEDQIRVFQSLMKQYRLESNGFDDKFKINGYKIGISDFTVFDNENNVVGFIEGQEWKIKSIDGQEFVEVKESKIQIMELLKGIYYNKIFTYVGNFNRNTGIVYFIGLEHKDKLIPSIIEFTNPSTNSIERKPGYLINVNDCIKHNVDKSIYIEKGDIRIKPCESQLNGTCHKPLVENKHSNLICPKCGADLIEKEIVSKKNGKTYKISECTEKRWSKEQGNHGCDYSKFI